MNTEKVGRFIAEQRKKKELTQKQLADMLGVTDKAVSRWETGKGYPDIEILKALSEKLNVSINELLSGEIIPQERIAESAEEHIVYAYRKEKRTKKTSKIAVSVILICSLLICSIFALGRSNSDSREYIATIENTQTDEMITKLEYLLWENCRIGGKEIYEHTVCTDFNIKINTDNEILEFSMELQNNDFSYKTEITAFEGENNNQLRIVHGAVDRSKLGGDGFTYSSIMDALKNIDLVSLCKKHAPKEAQYSEMWVGFGGETTFSDKVATFGSDYQYLYENGKLNPVTTTEPLYGKNYVFDITPLVQGQEENMAYASCCIVYIKR